MTRKNNFARILLGISFCLWIASPLAAQTDAADLKLAHRAVLEKWLAANSDWRLELEKDYGADNLEFFRQGEGAEARPFYVAADFNRDQREDFAVLLMKGENGYGAAIFNAPFSAPEPAFFTDKIEPGDIVYYNQNSKLLLVGPYASDAGFSLQPRGKTYEAKYFEAGN